MESEPLKSGEEKLRERLVAEAYQPARDISYNSLDNKNKHNLNNNDDDVTNKKKLRCQSARMLGLLIGIILVCVALIIIFFISVIIKARSGRPDSEVCTSEACIKASGVMLSRLDSSYDQCDDFYEYACHKFISDNRASSVEEKKDSFVIVGKEMAQILKSLLEGADVEIGGRQSKAIANSRKFYNSCLNITLVQERGIKPVLQLINSLGGWPMLSPTSEINAWNADEFSLERTLVDLHKMSMFPLISLYTHADLIVNTRRTIIVNQGSLTYGDYAAYTDDRKDKYKSAYIVFVSEVVRLLGDVEDKSHLIKDMWELETALAKAYDKPGHDTDVDNIYNKFTASEAQKFFAKTLNVSTYMKALFGENVNPFTEYVFTNLEYFKKMSAILEETKPSTIANFLMWNVVSHVIEYLPTPFALIHRQFWSRIYETPTLKSKAEQCVEATKEAFGFALSSLYVKNYFPATEIEKVSEVFTTIIDAFRRRLPEKDWMDEETRRMANKKLDKLTFQIGYPQFVLNATALDEYYDFEVTDSIFENFLAMLKNLFKTMKDSLLKPIDPKNWEIEPISVNAYYAASMNQIYYPAALLRKPLYDSQDPASRKFAVTGGFMAHELTHAFDTTGRNMDADGRLVDWWSNHSAKVFHEKSNCFLHQYNQFKIGHYSLNGLLTLGENIADNGAGHIAFEAYQTWLDLNGGKDLILPGLNMTAEQQFFLAYAQSWCAVYNPSNEIQLLTTDTHSNARFRVNGVFQNMKKFSNAFQCPQDSYMNPTKKCTLW